MRRLGLALLLLLALAAPARAASTGPCFPGGPTCHLWYVKVADVNDGDTIDVHVGGRIRSIRFNSAQAMELTRYSHDMSRIRGECTAVPAARRVYQLLREGGWRVRLSSQHPTTDSTGRLFRWLAVRIHGRWVDLGDTLVREGLALWMPGIVETGWNHRYDVDQQLARRDGRYLWNPVQCGSGPRQDVPLRLWVQSDPSGIDVGNLDGEWIKVANLGTRALPLTGWWVRSPEHERYHFPRGTILPAGGTITVHVGSGANSATDLYWGLRKAEFDNAGDARNLGGGGFLFDPDGDARASMIYPCLLSCGDPNQGAFALEAHPRSPEYTIVRNDSSRTIDLYGYEVSGPADVYEFQPGDTLAPGASRRVSFGADRRLPDVGGGVRLQRYDDFVLACTAWGDISC